jgi:hypothetical protein
MHPMFLRELVNAHVEDLQRDAAEQRLASQLQAHRYSPSAMVRRWAARCCALIPATRAELTIRCTRWAGPTVITHCREEPRDIDQRCLAKTYPTTEGVPMSTSTTRRRSWREALSTTPHIRLALVSCAIAIVALAACDHKHNPPPAPSPAGPAAKVEVCNETLDVPEALADVDTSCTLVSGDEVHIGATGQIKSGVFLAGWSGPQGWNFTAGNNFPKPGAASFSLLARTESSYRYVGTGTEFTYFGSGTHLYLRINDDSPNNGEGAFQANVQVYRR